MEPPDNPSGTSAQDAEEATSPSPADGSNPGETYPVIKQESFDELYDLLGTRFSDLCDAMSAVNRKADVSARRIRLMFAVAVMIIVILAGLLAVLFAYFRIQRDNTAQLAALARDSEKREVELRADLAAVSGKADDIQKIRDDLPAQRKAFEAAIEEMKESASSAQEAQIELEKERYAAERLKELSALLTAASGKVEDLQEKNDALEGRLADVSGRAEDLQEKNDSLADRLSEADRRAADEAEARKKAEEERDRLRDVLTATSGASDDLQKLRDELIAQREVFEATIEEMRKASGTALEAQKAHFEEQIAFEKEQSAAERDKLRADLEAASGKAEELQKKNETLADELSAASGKAGELQKKNETLAGELTAAEKRAADEAEARKKAEAEAENARRAAESAQNGRETSPDAGQSPVQ